MSLVSRLALVLVFATGAFAQLFSYGIKGGAAVTDAFEDQTQLSAINSSLSSSIHTFSSSKDYVIGPTVELHLPFHLSVEGDALFRPYYLSSSENYLATESVGSISQQTSAAVHAWEFPILAKYRFSGPPLIKPYVAAGPSFRAAGSSGNGLSSKGFTIGGGVDVKALILHVSPEVRYTYWAQGSPVDASTTPAYSNQNQVELLVGLTF